jgi:hypothetical protein
VTHYQITNIKAYWFAFNVLFCLLVSFLVKKNKKWDANNKFRDATKVLNQI